MISVAVVMTVYLHARQPNSMQRSRVNLQFDDMRMSQQLEILDLSLHAAGHVPGHELLTRYNLQSHLLSSGLVDSQFHLAERALPKRLEDVVLAKPLRSPSRHLRLRWWLPVLSGALLGRRVCSCPALVVGVAILTSTSCRTSPGMRWVD